MDLFDRLKPENTPLGRFHKVDKGYYTFPKLEGELSSRMMFNGKEKILWSLNNYLGLANHPEVRAIDAKAAADWGMAYPMGSRMMSGNSSNHHLLEDQLSDFLQKEDTVLLNFGYQGILSAIDAIVSRKDAVIYDAESHACIMDGIKMIMGKRYSFKHNDMESLEKSLERATAHVETTGGGILVITEGVFSMAGDQGKLKEMIALKEKYPYRLMVDDAHGFGVMGKTGMGTGEEQGVQDGIDIYFATFAKSMASIGACISSTKDVVGFLRYSIRSQIFAKSVPMPIVVGAMKRLDMIRTMPELREKLWTNVRNLQSGLQERGFDLGRTNSPVTAVMLHGSVDEAAKLVWDLRETYSIFCTVVMYPVIPKGEILLRLIPTAMHTQDDIDQTLDAFAAVAGKLKDGTYKSMPQLVADD